MNGRKIAILILAITALLIGFAFWLNPGLNLVWSEYLIMVQSVQRDFHQSLSEALRRVEADGFHTSLLLIGLSFLYGVFHAAGPGHGKIVISTYLLSHETQLRRGVILSLAASLVQAFTAIAIVSSAVWLLDLSMRQTRRVADDVEIASFALIAIVGLAIVIARSIKLIKSFRTVSVHSEANHHHDHHGHDCQHAHGPDASDLDSPLSFRTFIGIVLSIGIRPCSGAVIVLLLAYSLGLELAGLFSVLAMSLGTALTVSLLATISVYMRATVKRLFVMLPDGNLSMGRIMDMVGLMGGVVIFAFGATLLNIALFTPVHPFR